MINGTLTVNGGNSSNQVTQLVGTDDFEPYENGTVNQSLTVNRGATVNVNDATLSYSNISMTGATLNITGVSTADEGGSANIYAYGTPYDYETGDAGDNAAVNYDNADVTLTETKITLSSGGFIGAMDGVAVTGGSLDVTGDKNVIKASTRGDAEALVISGTEISLAAGASLKLKSDSAVVTGGSVKNEGNMDFTGTDVTVDGSLLSGIFASGSMTLSHDGTVDLNVTGTDTVNLTDLGIVKEDDGTLGDKLSISGSATLNTDSVKLGHTYAADKLDLNVRNLTATTTTREGVVSSANGGFFIDNGTVSVSDTVSLTSGSGLTGETRLYVYGKSGDATLNLVNDGTTQGKLVNVDRFYVGYTSDSASSPNKGILNVAGDWDFAGTRFTVGKSGAATFSGNVDNIGSLWLNDAGATLTVKAGADVTAGRLGETNTSAGTIFVNGTLTFTGDGDPDDKNDAGTTVKDITLTKETVTVNNGGELAISGEAVDSVISFTPAEGDTEQAISIITANWAADKVTVSAGGELNVDLGYLNNGSVAMTASDFKTLTTGLVNSSSMGTVNLGNVTISDLNEVVDIGEDTGLASYDSINTAGLNNGATDQVSALDVSVTASNNSTGVKGSFATVTIDPAAGDVPLNVTNTLTLGGANGGNFVTATSGDTTVAADVSVMADSAVVLNGAGTVGALTAASSADNTAAVLDAGNGTQNVDEISLARVNVKSGTVNVEGNVSAADELVLNGNLNNTASEEGQTNSVTATTLTMTAGTLTTNTLTIGDASNGATASTVKGQIKADSVVFKGANTANRTTVDGNATVFADKMTVESGASVFFGSDGEDGSAGFLDAGLLGLADGAKLIVDPEFGQHVGLAVAEHIDSDGTATEWDPETTSTFAGDIIIGKNSAFGLGFETTGELMAAIAEYLDGSSSLSDTGVGSIAYLNRNADLSSTGNIYVDPTKTSTELETVTNSQSGVVTLGKDAALIIGEDVDMTGTAYAITGATSATADADSTVVIKGVYGAGETLNLISGSGVNDDSFLAEIEAGNGLLDGEYVDASDAVQIKLTKAQDFDAKLYNVSSPVNALYNHVYDGDYSDRDVAGVDYIFGVGGHDGGKSVEATSRLGVYGGAVQAAYLAQQTSTDAVADRLGMASVNSALVYADNAQGGGLWLMPVYRSLDSDGFNAQGVDYGTDIDLYGVALGADFTTDSGVRVGGYFNVGSGDADGQQVASEVSNDFDYYGVGIYAGMTFGQFGLIADMGFTQVSNDLEQNAYYAGKLTADADSSAVTAGLRAEYALELASVDVVPHLGVRYTRLDMDSYDVTGADGVYASTSSDSMSVFSIPFGVSVSTDIAAGNWSVKPVFDVTLTANTGDDELDSDTTFTGAGMTSALSTEVLDSFTYGGTVGVQAKYGESLSLGVGLNYTGSDNTDAFGVTGDIRYMF